MAYANGSLTGSGATTVESNANSNIRLGANKGAIRHFDGIVGEIIYIQDDLDTPTRQKLEGYLAHKWGMTADLPALHPYKSRPPTV